MGFNLESRTAKVAEESIESIVFLSSRMASSEEVVDVEVARRKMKEWREEGYRNSDEVVEFGECLLLEHGNKLGDELWTIHEQVFVAALDCGRMDLATSCLRALHQQFPKSLRVKKLRGMRFEALEEWENAKKIYKIILNEDPANLIVRKRSIAITKAQNKTVDTVNELKEYLDVYMSDQEAWMELAEMYISLQEFHKAAFCLEELILTHPHNHLYHQRFAEIHYTIGSVESLELSRKYFAQALKLDPNNIRALYGLFLCSSNQNASMKGNIKVKRNNARYSNWAAQEIMEKYGTKIEGKSMEQMSALEQMFDSLQLALPTNIPE